MPLAPADMLTVEEWTGPLDGDDQATANTIFDGLGGGGRPIVLFTAYKMLKRRLGQFVWEVADLASASDRSSHSRNHDWIVAQIDRLLGVLGSLDLPGDLADEIAESGASASLRPIALTVENPRVQ